MAEAFVLEHLRTPRGRASPRGSLHHLTPIDLVVALQRELVHRTGLDPGEVQDVVLGVASQTGEQGADLARTAVLMAGWPDRVPGCHGEPVLRLGHRRRRAGRGEGALRRCGPGRRRRGGERLPGADLQRRRRAVVRSRTSSRAVGSVHMGIAADLNRDHDGLTRERLDAYGVGDPTKAAAAWAQGRSTAAVVALPGATGIRPTTS